MLLFLPRELPNRHLIAVGGFLTGRVCGLVASSVAADMAFCELPADRVFWMKLAAVLLMGFMDMFALPRLRVAENSRTRQVIGVAFKRIQEFHLGVP